MQSSVKSSLKSEARPSLLESLIKAGTIGSGNSSTTTRTRFRITPEIAREWLEKTNLKNRPMSELKWTAYAVDMLEGRWQYNGDAIRFGSDGVLLDGQHRLMACVEAGVAFESDVIFGLDPDVLGTIDIGEVRRAGDIVHLDGIENGRNACALAYLVLIHRKHGIHRINHWQAKPTKTQIVEAVKAEPRLAQVAGRAVNFSRELAAPRIISFCYFVFSEQAPELGEQFFTDFSQGVNLRSDSPVYHLRERLLANRISKSKLPDLEIIALFFKAWIAYWDGRAIRNLRWRSEGPAAEKFPDITR